MIYKENSETVKGNSVFRLGFLVKVVTWFNLFSFKGNSFVHRKLTCFINLLSLCFSTPYVFCSLAETQRNCTQDSELHSFPASF